MLRAAGELLAAEQAFSLADVALAAGTSTATAYRHFASAEDVADAFVGGFIDDVEARLAGAPGVRAGAPRERLLLVCRLWTAAVLDWGPALAHLRSAEGFLARRARGEPVLLRSLADVEPTLAAVLRDTHGSVRGRVDYAITVWNALADPREVLEQHRVLGWSAERSAERLHRAVLAVITDRRR